MAKGDLEVNITAIDRASDKIQDVAKQAERLGDEEGEIVLKAEVKAAEKDLRRLRKELKDADGEEAEVRILADIDQAKRDIAALDGELDAIDGRKVEAKAEIDASGAGKTGEEAGSAFGLNAIKGIGLAGIGAAIVATFNSGFDRIKARAQMVAQFGLIKEDADRLSKEAGEIYAGNWGDSVGDVQQVLGLVQQQLVEVGVVSEEEMGKVAESAIVVSEAFGVDVNQVIRSTSQLLLNGLAPDADTAFDQVTAALQGGANKADDFWDTIDEYSQHFGALGLDAGDMFAIIEDGFANGQRDSDKLADAVKEFRLRAVDTADEVGDAYDDLGLNADEYRRKILEGGDSARGAFIDILRAIQSVENPIEQNQIAVALIGTMYEDLGPTAIGSLLAIENATKDVTGALDEVNEGLSNSASELDKLGRKAQSVFGTVSEELAGTTNTWLTFLGTGEDSAYMWSQQALGRDNLTVSFDKSTDAMKRGSQATVQLMIDSELAAKAEREMSGAMVQASIDAALLENSTDDVTEATEELTEAEREATEAAEEREAQIGELIARMDDLAGRNASLVGGTIGVENAHIRAREAAHEFGLALLGVDEEGKKVELTADEMTLAFNEATSAQMNAAQTAADYEIAQREANGETVSASDKNAILAQKYRDIASELDPGNPLRQRLEDYATELDEIPGEVVTAMSITAPFDEVARYAELINGVPNLRETTLRTIRENVNREQRFQQNRFGESHTGSRFAAGQTKIVVPGQVFTPDVGGRMSSMEESRRMTSAPAQQGSASGTPVYITLMNGEQVKGMFDERDADLLRSLEGGLR